MAEAVSWVRDEVEDVARKSRSFLTRHAGLLLLTGSITFNIVSILGVDSVAWGHYEGISGKPDSKQNEFLGLLATKFCNEDSRGGDLNGHIFCYIDLSYSTLATLYKANDGGVLTKWVELLEDCEGKGRAAFGLIIVSTILTFLSWFSVVYQKNSSGLKSKAYSVGLPLLSFMFLVIALLVWHQGCILHDAPSQLAGGLVSSSGVYLVALSAAMVGAAGLHQLIYLCMGGRDAPSSAVDATVAAAGGTHTLDDAESGSFEPPVVRSAVSAPPAAAKRAHAASDPYDNDGPAYGGEGTPDDVYGTGSGGAYGSSGFGDEDPFKT